MSCPDSPPGGGAVPGGKVAGAAETPGQPAADDTAERYPQWPKRVIALARTWKTVSGESARQALLGEFWLLINAALLRYLGPAAAGRPFFVDPEVQRDIASEKALSLVRKIDDGSWDPGASTPGQLCAYLGVVVRNGLADHERTSVAERRRAERIAQSAPAEDPWTRQKGDAASPETLLWREQFAGALLECLNSLTARSRTIWFLKVFYELGSHEVGSHPALGMKAGAVDVAWGRCRRQVESCLTSRGFSTHELPTGTFTTMWHHFRSKLNMEV